MDIGTEDGSTHQSLRMVEYDKFPDMVLVKDVNMKASKRYESFIKKYWTSEMKAKMISLQGAQRQ